MSSEDGWSLSHELAAKYAIEGLRALVLANGGAVVAILTFAGNASARVDPAVITVSLRQFSLGLLAALMTILLTYLAQTAATHDRRRTTNVVEAISMVMAITSMGLFGWGAQSALAAFQAYSPPVQTATLSMTCEDAVAFVRAQVDPGDSSARNNKTGNEAVLVRGGWVILPTCK